MSKAAQQQVTKAIRPSFSGLLSDVTAIGNDAGPIQWEAIKNKVVVKTGTHRTIPIKKGGICDPKKNEQDLVRIVMISDTHNAHDSLTQEGEDNLLPRGDILIHAGDFSDVGKKEDIVKFSAWLKKIRSRFTHVVVIAGNHDLSLCSRSYDENWKRFGHPEKYNKAELVAILKENCTYLEDESVEIEGFKIFGTPTSPWFHNWGMNTYRDPSHEYSCRSIMEKIPKDTDIVVAHGPPLGFGDACAPMRQGQPWTHQGCADLLDWILDKKISLVVAGHIHESHGAYLTEHDTLVVNASTMDLQYNAAKPQHPIVVDLPRKKKSVTSAAS